MRVLLIVHGYPPRALGGTEIYTSHLARALQISPPAPQGALRQTHGDEVFVLTREASPERPEYAVRRERRDGVEVFSINHTFRDSRSFEDTYKNPVIGRLAGRILDQIRPEVAHIQHLTCLGTDLVAELARRRIPTCFTLNDYWLICHRGQLFDLDFRPCDGPHRGCRRCVVDAAAPAARRMAPLWRRVERRLPAAIAGPIGRGARRLARERGDGGAESDPMARRVRHVRAMAAQVPLFLAPSRTLRQRFLDFGFPADRLRYFEQGIDQRSFGGFTRDPAYRLRIGFLGSLMVSKAPHVLLEAFAGLPPGAASLEIYGGFAPYHGDDGYRRRLEPLLAAAGIRHHGPVPNAEVPRALASIDVLVVPSVWLENAPFVIREAFAAGVPVVASDRGGMAEMVAHEKNGLLFRPGDAGDLRRTLARLLDESGMPDHGLLGRLRAGIPRPRTIEEAAGELREIYRALAREAAPVPRLAAVVLNYRTPRETVLAVRSLESSDRPVDEVVVVDNASGDGSAAWLRDHLPPAVRLVATERNLGFSGGSNAGIRAALEGGAERVLLLNGDAMVAPGCVGRLEEALGGVRPSGDPEAGIAGPTLLDARDPSRIASRGIAFSPWTGRMRHPEAGRLYDRGAAPSPARVAAVSGCGMLVERRVFEAVGFFDEDYFFSFEDLDFCLRGLRAGFATVVVGDAVAYHHGSRSIGPSSPRRLYFAARNHLLAARRGAPVHPVLGIPRAKIIIALNLAFALLGAPVPGGLGAVVRGVFDHLRRRYGDPDSYSSS